jgi:hypothetical protein
MITGVVRDGRPWVPIELVLWQADESLAQGVWPALRIEFVFDTAFQGDLALSASVIDQFPTARFTNESLWRLADGSHRPVDMFEMDLDWNSHLRRVEIIALSGTPLVGTEFFKDCYITIHLIEGGEVQIDLPD